MYKGFLSSVGTNVNPDAWAISIIAVLVFFNNPYVASTFLAIGPVTSIVSFLPFIPWTKASTVPSPPSASGNIFTCASSLTFNIPFFIAFPASIEDKLPFKESIEINIFILIYSFLLLLILNI